ncbi:MAG: hypothetical protein GQ547_05640 [Methylophaga sp.]|nr:hypothetical protein [Methylophaga sp.]
MNGKLLKNISKWLWMAALLGFIVFYTTNHKELIYQTFSLLSFQPLLLASALVLAGKLCLVTNMSLATKHFEIFLGWRDCYCIYNLTQLAKYIPGSIWQFVGRFSILHERGIAKRTIRDSMIAEHLWVIASASLLAILLSFNSMREFFVAKLAEYSSDTLFIWWLVILFVLISAIILFILLGRRLFFWFLRILPPFSAIPVLVLTWIFLGASLWVTLEPYVVSMPSVFYIIGIYCFAYVMGFIVPFAPAGIGIREAILTFALTFYMDADVAILLTAINRMIYFAVEIILAISCLHIKRQ